MDTKLTEAIKHYRQYSFIPQDWEEMFVKLAEDYEAMSARWPEEKEVLPDYKCFTPLLKADNALKKEFNQARHLCILAVLKMLDVERIADVLDTELPWLREDLLKLANKIRNAIVREEGK